MPKQCKAEGCSWDVWGKGYCKSHQYMRTDKKPKPLKRTPIKKRSSKQEKIDAAYSILCKQYKKNHPVCEVCNDRATQDVHHKAYRGSKTLDESTYLAVCRTCHNYIHSHPQWARDNQYLI